MIEFTPLGPCPGCGSHRWREARCECDHGVSVHSFGKRGERTIRTACTRTTGAVKCPCKIFTEAAA